jgi:hypothetical protein
MMVVFKTGRSPLARQADRDLERAAVRQQQLKTAAGI